MNFEQYQQLSERTIDKTKDNKANFSLGLAGEAGETVDIIKKYLFHGHQINHEKLENELGDVLWYVSAICSEFNINLEDVAKTNIKKLKERYPEGFEESKSINRLEHKLNIH
jgi:NTP pyrophosphatase (non-canonical NTP hydrolase)